MTILTEKKKNMIAKQLAAIYYTAVHWWGSAESWQDEKWEDFVKCIVGNCADIAFAVGGEQMMNIEVPALVMRLDEQLHSAEKGET